MENFSDRFKLLEKHRINESIHFTLFPFHFFPVHFLLFSRLSWAPSSPYLFVSVFCSNSNIVIPSCYLRFPSFCFFCICQYLQPLLFQRFHSLVHISHLGRYLAQKQNKKEVVFGFALNHFHLFFATIKRSTSEKKKIFFYLRFVFFSCYIISLFKEAPVNVCSYQFSAFLYYHQVHITISSKQ